MKKKYPLILILTIALLSNYIGKSQVTLNADGPGNTYELINSVLAPGFDAVEAPDLIHSGFGRHITEVFDAGLNKNVFEFFSHVTPDDDPNNPALTDRQRVEIKTYDQSPANLKGTMGETVTYKWRFKIPVGYKPSTSFTHLHQIKPVNGDDSDPLFTLTARKGSPNKLELTYTEISTGSTTKPAIVNLSLFEGIWVEATEQIEIGTAGKYAITIKRVTDGTTLFTYSNLNILTIRPDNSFIRPKWGIYRSIATPLDLRDETVRFSDFSIAEGSAALVGATYFWVGGATGDVANASSWNTSLDGTGTDRSTPDNADVLIFDGTNIGGATPLTGPVTPIIASSFTIGQLFFQNGVTVTLKRPSSASAPVPPATTITSIIIINGDGTPADDFIISPNSTVNITSELTGYGINIVLGSAVGPILATGTVFGIINVADGGLATTRITVSNPNSLFFANSSTLTSNLTLNNNYPFGSNSPTITFPSAAFGAVFQAGSKLIYLAGNSVVGNTQAFYPIKFEKGSLLEMNANNPAGMFNTKSYANVLVKSPAVVTLTESFFNIDTLTINSGAAFNLRGTSFSPISGDIINNGTFGAAAPISSSQLVLVGTVPQTIGGTGIFNNLGGFTVANDAEVTLNGNLNIVGTTTSNIIGKLNTQTNVISGTSAFQLRAANPGVASAATITAGLHTVTLTDATAYSAANVAIGAKVVGPAFQPNTFVIGTSSGTFTFTISKPALTSFPTLTGTVTLTTTSATLETANTGGIDGTITTSGTKTFGSNSNYIYNAATTTPFNTITTNSMGNVTFNAAATTNKINQSISGTLTLNAGNLTIRATDTLRITSGNDIAGAPFSASKYVVSTRASNNLGVLRMDNFSTAKTFPIGSATNYLPVTLTPTSPMSYAVSVFEGATVDGTPEGMPVSATIKDESVDAEWIINRTSGTGDCAMQLNWAASLEGATFSTLSNTNLGISRYDGLAYEATTGSGDNAANNATSTFANFSPFIVTKKAGVVPVQFKSITASIKQNGTEVKWNLETEDDVQSYIVEKSIDGRTFAAIGTVVVSNSRSYTFNDLSILSNSIAYYRIRIVSLTGSVKYSSVVFVKQNNSKDVVVYPNPVNELLSVAGLKGNSVLKLINGNGQVVLQQSTTASSISIDATKVEKGIYILQVYSNGNKQSSRTIIKQ
jgi:hypothetical protein